MGVKTWAAHADPIAFTRMTRRTHTLIPSYEGSTEHYIRIRGKGAKKYYVRKKTGVRWMGWIDGCMSQASIKQPTTKQLISNSQRKCDYYVRKMRRL